jgi:2-dehydro-3-deoxygalactonokinase
MTVSLKGKNLSDFFFSCDWGTSNFRLRLVSTKSQAVVAEMSNVCGAKVIFQESDVSTKTAPEESRFASILLEGMDQLCQETGVSEPSMQVVVSGMASSSIGWVELPYAQLPFALDGSSAVTANFSLKTSLEQSVSVLLISGVQSEDDVMRGEETEVLGFFSQGKGSQSASETWLVLPGTHSKHVCLQGGKIVAFRTFLTGELFDLFCNHSILSQSVSSASNSLEASMEASFCEGLKTARTLGLSSGLFSVRTNTLLKQISEAENTAFLSGLLIGSEILESPALQSDSSVPLVLDGRTHLSSSYERAFSYLFPDRQLVSVDREKGLPPVVLGHMLLLEHYQD